MKENMNDIKCETLVCPNCKKSYGINVRKDKTIRCRLCGYEGVRAGVTEECP